MTCWVWMAIMTLTICSQEIIMGFSFLITCMALHRYIERIVSREKCRLLKYESMFCNFAPLFEKQLSDQNELD